jgi:SAM-dependent methyltransferase
MNGRTIVRMLFVCLAALTVFALAKQYATSSAVNQKRPRSTGINAPYIQTLPIVVQKMVEAAQLTESDLVYDLGCGDGRLVIAAVKSSGCRGVGIDIQSDRILESRAQAKTLDVADRITFLHQDLFTADISQASAVLIYLNSWMLERLKPQLSTLPKGARVVSQDFWLEQVQPDRVQTVSVKGAVDTVQYIYSYTMPMKIDTEMEIGKPPGVKP